jgi:hypothetical protein
VTDAPRFTRRHALAAGALASGVGLGATVVRVGSWWKKDTGPGLQILAPEEAELVDAVAEALFPAGGTPELSGADAGVSAWLDAHFVHLPDDTASQLRLLMNALDDWARLTQGARWAELPVERRSAKLESWMRADNHLVRGAISGLVIFVSMGYCLHPEVKDACGWQWPCGMGK